jgi:putative aldouronate transport system permease protein
VIATVALWSAVGHWNAWFDALIYLKSENKIVLQLLLRRLIQEMTLLSEQMNSFMAIEKTELPSAAVKAAITILTIGPIIIAYPFLQKHFIKGIFLGSLKG